MPYRYLFFYASMLMILSVLLSYSLSTYVTMLYHYKEIHFFYTPAHCGSGGDYLNVGSLLAGPQQVV
ncbi:hypothetical protein HBZS_121780 [Helicobacter bizzozeronii CCUG 35545]|nr:hypothetical protein HBZS_121780 [Helicobacter bizzozeronii CCUG 35545]